MAAPPAFRLAIEACRPSKSSVIRLRSPLQSKRFISNTRSLARPEISSATPQPSNSTKDAPPATRSNASTIRQAVTQSEDEGTASSPMRKEQEKPTGLELLSQASDTSIESEKPLPPNVLATYRVPMKHQPQYGLPVASLQLRSFSLRNLEFFADYCLRAAFYLKLPASGPVPLPRKTERWTVLRSNFVHKKSQENFERITYRRLITIMDGHPDTVERWLAFVRKWQFYGVGMKANVWEFSSLDVGAKMDQVYKSQVEKELSEKLKEFGFNKAIAEKTSLDRLLRRVGTKVQGVPMTGVRQRSITKEQRQWDQGLEVDASNALSDRR